MGLFLPWRWDSSLGQAFLSVGCVLILWASNAFAEDLMKTATALGKIFPKAVAFNERDIQLSAQQIQSIEAAAHLSFGTNHADKVIMHVAQGQNQVLGYAFEDTVIGKWGPIHYLVGLDVSGNILEIVILDYQEIRGRPIAKPRFLRQYKGKNIHDAIELHKDIDGITGATISSGSLTAGVRKILYIYEFIKPELSK